MGVAVVENRIWVQQHRTSLVVVLGNGPAYNPARQDPPRKRQAQFFVNPEARTTTTTLQVAIAGGIGYNIDVQRYPQAKVFTEYQSWDNPWRPAPRLVTDFTQGNSDIFAGMDTYGWPPEGPEPPKWVNEMRGTFNTLQFFPAYNPANDMFLFRRMSQYTAEPEVFWTGAKPIGAWGTTYIPGTDARFARQDRFMVDPPAWWDFKQPITANAITSFAPYNPATDVTRFLRQDKTMVPHEFWWTGQPKTINAITFTPPPYNPGTDVRFARQSRDLLDEPTWWRPQVGISIVVNVPQIIPPTPPTPVLVAYWGGRVVLSPKKRGEDVIVPMDFISRLAVGETILTATVAASVYSGTDPNPSLILDGNPIIAGTIVEQKVTTGVLGVIYELLYTVKTSLGQTLELSGYFVVQPDLP